MRTITKNDQKFTVTEHIILKNFWEYYILEEEDRPEDLSENIQMALVMGIEQEIGDVDIKEIAPYIVTRTKDLENLMPPAGWTWQ